MTLINYISILYISIGVVLYAISIWRKFTIKGMRKYTVVKELFLFTGATLLIILFWPLVIIVRYNTYKKYKILLKGKVNPFYKFFIINKIN